jgi:hypothetical protein
MAVMATRTTTKDAELLAQLRKRFPGDSEAKLRKRVAVVKRGDEVQRRVWERTAAAGISAEEVEAEAIRVVMESQAGAREALLQCASNRG